MTNRQALEQLLKTEALLKSTKAGYAPDRPIWKRAMPMLWKVREGVGDPALGAKLAQAHGILRETTKGYEPTAPRWRKAMALIDQVEAELHRPPVPDLGPVVRGDKPLLLWAPTHNTDGLLHSPNVPKANGGNGSNYPAFDSAFGGTGRVVTAPERLRVTGQSSAEGADAFYALGLSGIGYWFGHIVSSPATGHWFDRGERLGQVAKIAMSDGGPHLHVGMDTRRLIGHDLEWGAHGNGPDYTFGSPTVGVQLAKALAI